jgi:ribosomal protein L37AE/L43A
VEAGAVNWQITIKKATASAVNVTVVFTATSPIYYFLGIDVWRIVCIALFFSYNLLQPRRCLGQRVAHTYQNEPTNLSFAALYTASTATLLWWVFVPLDLALANGLLIQLPCLALRGNTLHGLLTGRKTVTETERLFECVALRGHCPDCDEPTLERTGSYVRCHQCHSAFFAADLMVTRVKMVEA